jgi:uncharacterized protein (TIGR03067 family)
MSKSLPARPNLEHLRTQAKHLLSRLRASDDEAARTFIDHLPAARRMTPVQVRAAGFRLADAQSAVARQSGFAAWSALARHVEQLRSVEGEWSFESLEVDGNTMPAAALGGSRLMIDGDRFRMESPDANYDGIFTIDIEADPAQIDIEFVDGPEAGQWSYGIFHRDGDELVLCLGLVGCSRPTTFNTSPGSGHALERLRRSSSARPADVDGGRRRESAAPVPSIVAAADGFDGPITPFLEQLQGHWVPTALITDGKPLAEAHLPFGWRTIAGNETKVVFGGQVMLHAKMRLDESRSPMAVDYLSVKGDGNRVTLGILEVHGESLRFCMATSGGDRPTDFSCERGSGRTFSEWRRKP